MSMTSPSNQWVTITEAVEIAGCTDGYLRRLLREERLRGWRAGDRAWLVHRADLMRLKSELSTRSNLRAAERKSLRRASRKRA